MPGGGEVLYEFIESPEVSSGLQLFTTLAKVGDPGRVDRLFDILLWYGFLGLVREEDETTYIYSVRYDAKRLNAMIQKRGRGECTFRINPAFWRALEVSRHG
jgi:hypothetical protein